MLALLRRLVPPTLLLLVAFAVFWKGGKSLETTWLLAGFAGAVTYIGWSTTTGRALNTTQRAAWWLFLAFILWSIAAFVLSSTRNYGLDEILRDTSFFLLFASLLREPPSNAFIRRCCAVLGIAALIAVGIGLIVYILQPVNRFVGTFFDHRFHTDYWPNAWAQFLLLAWPAGLVGLLQAKMNTWRSWMIRGVFAGILLAGLLLSFSRGAFIALMGQLLLLCLLALPGWRTLRVTIRPVLVSAGIVVAIGLLLFTGANTVRGRFHDVQSVGEKVTFTADEGTSSIDERSQFWHQSWTLAQQRPWFGWGPYSFRFVQPRLQEHVLATSDHPHNVFLKLAMERGIPAMLLFIALLLAVVAPALWRLRQLHSGDWEQRLIIVAVLGVLAHNLIDFNLQFVGIALPWWLLLGFLAAHDASAQSKRRVWLRRGLEVALAAALLVITVTEGRFLVLSSFGRHAQAAGEVQTALYWYDASANQIFSRDLHLSRAQLAIEAQELDEAAAVMQTYLRFNPEDARGWSMDAHIADIQGNTERQLTSARLAFQYGAYDYVAIARGLTHALQQAKEPIEPWKPTFDRLFDAYAGALQANVHFIALSQNADDFLAWAQELAALYPADAARYAQTAKRAEANILAERKRFSARTPGQLW